MSGRRGRGLPDDLPPAVARYQASWRTVAMFGLAVLVICGLEVGWEVVTGTDPSAVLNYWTLAAGVSILLIVLKERWHVLAAGPGWLSSREFVRTRWVRTDRLVRLSWEMGGRIPVLTLVDDKGRRVVITSTDLYEDARLAIQVKDDVRRSLAGGLKADKRALAELYLDVAARPLNRWQPRRRTRRQRAR